MFNTKVLADHRNGFPVFFRMIKKVSQAGTRGVRDSDKRFDDLINRCQNGCESAQAELAEHVNEDFYEIAKRLCSGKSFVQSMHATNLLNETFLRLIKAGVFRKSESGDHLFCIAAKTMRSVIADYLRNRCAAKRKPTGHRVYLDEVVDQLQSQPFEMCQLNDALEKLETSFPRRAKIVNFRFFLGMTVEETAQELDVSTSTVEKEWRAARKWLFKELHE